VKFGQCAAGALMLRQIAQQAVIGEVKAWPHAAAHQAPGPGGAGRLPPIRFDNSHRSQPVCHWAKPLTPNLTACRWKGQQLKGISPCEVPGFIGCANAVPAADFAGMEQKKIVVRADRVSPSLRLMACVLRWISRYQPPSGWGCSSNWVINGRSFTKAVGHPTNGETVALAKPYDWRNRRARAVSGFCGAGSRSTPALTTTRPQGGAC
jgi:hypothetical protein